MKKACVGIILKYCDFIEGQIGMGSSTLQAMLKYSDLPMMVVYCLECNVDT